MIKDSIGNRLDHGHFIDVKLPGLSSIRGRIKTIDEGRIARIGGAYKTPNGQIQPGLVTVEILLPIEFDPQTNVIPAVIRVWDPTGEDLKGAKTLTSVEV